ncbi:hypothetical protein NX059_011147 [Plenodomus lindquistii]|nr:hypothetical protein NX059_011147 [Plenodomus lindquistii]
MAAPWETTAKAKREAILAAIPPEWRLKSVPTVDEQVDVTEYIKQFLSTQEVEITQSPANELATQIASGTWSAEIVTQSFCHAAALAHQLLSCLHEIFFDAAIAQAKELDAYLKEHGKTVGPLHGVPVSLKDQFHVKDVETSMGYVGWIGTFEGEKGTGKEKVYESEMVGLLRKAGAVLYVKTSVPHTLMSGETVNNIIGYTLNPKNRNLTAGGSSGGEGALIGIRGSPLGLGTDIGGSIRIPAAFNGLYGLRPSVGRLPYHGMANSMDGQNSILSVVGPLATNAASLRLLTQAILQQQPWDIDPAIHPIPWRSSASDDITSRQQSGNLVFAVYKTDSVVTPHPPVLRAIDETVAALKAAGHEVVEWTPPSHKHIVDTTLQTWTFDAGRDVQRAFALSGEPMAPQISFFQDIPADQEYSATQIAQTNRTLRALRKEYLDYWNEMTGRGGRRVDAVVCPVAPFAGARRERYTYYAYSTWVNAMDFTSVVVPVTTVDAGVDKVVQDYQALGEQDKGIQADYDPEIYDGAHVSVQIVGRRLEEEKMISIAEYVGGLLEK